MRHLFLLIAVVLCVNLQAADIPPTSEASVKLSQLDLLDNLITVTQQNLENEKQLKQLIKEYIYIQDAYLKNPKDKDLTLKMVKSAQKVFEKMKETNLTQAFDPDFVGEITFFSQIASKRGIPKP